MRIPSHISILHVEQEVVGDDTPALESVLQCDFVRHRLLTREKEINTLIANGYDNELTLHFISNCIGSATHVPCLASLTPL